MMLKRKIERLLFVALAFALGGCGAITSFHDVENITTVDELRQTVDSKAIVFGRFEWFENERQVAKIPVLYGVHTHYDPRGGPKETRQRYEVKASEDGAFVWSLKSGRYRFDSLYEGSDLDSNWVLRCDVGFDVPEEKGFYYVGTIKAVHAVGRDFGGIPSGCAQFFLSDDFENEGAVFARKFGVPAKRVEKSLMEGRRHPRRVEWTSCYIIWPIIVEPGDFDSILDLEK